jgi:hypothetical protein
MQTSLDLDDAVLKSDDRTIVSASPRTTGIHCESIDEDIGVQALIAGKPSNEAQSSLRRWLSTRNSGTP